MVGFLLLPIFALLLSGVPRLSESARSPEILEAVGVSLRTTLLSLLIVVVLGTPLAVVLSRSRSVLARLVSGLTDLPLVLPPAAAGLGLLLAFGRAGVVPTGLPFTAGAVVAAQVFVAAPFFIRAATGGFAMVNDELLESAAIEGAGSWAIFWRVIAPVTRGALGGGAIVAWARALGEFGATILFAGNLPGKTQTMPLAIYLGFETDLDQATALAVLLLIVAFGVLFSVRMPIATRRES